MTIINDLSMTHDEAEKMVKIVVASALEQGDRASTVVAARVVSTLLWAMSEVKGVEDSAPPQFEALHEKLRVYENPEFVSAIDLRNAAAKACGQSVAVFIDHVDG